MTNENKIINEANAYLSSNKTLEETAKDLNISKRTLQLHLGKLKVIDPKLNKLVLAKKESMQKQGRIKGGMLGKVKPSYTKEEAENVAKEIIKHGYTYEEASKKLHIPKSTIYEMVHSKLVSKDLRDMLDAVAVANNKGLTVEALVTKNRNKRGRK